MPDQDKQAPAPKKGVQHPGMMGDGTEEQNLNEPGDPSARITEAEVDEAFGQDRSRKQDQSRK